MGQRRRLVTRPCGWCGRETDAEPAFAVCGRCHGVVERLLIPLGFGEALDPEQHDPAINGLRYAVLQEARRAAQAIDSHEWEAAVGTYCDRLLAGVCDALSSLPFPREYVHLASFARREVIEFPVIFTQADPWRAEDFIQSTDLVAIAAANALPTRALKEFTAPVEARSAFLEAMWRADFWAEAWIHVQSNFVTAKRMGHEGIPLEDLLTTRFEPDVLVDFHDRVEELAGARKPEDYSADNPVIQAELTRRRLLPAQILQDIDAGLVENLGFGAQDLAALSNAAIALFMKEPPPYPQLPLFVSYEGGVVRGGTGLAPLVAVRKAYETAGGREGSFEAVIRAFQFLPDGAEPTMKFIDNHRSRSIYLLEDVAYVNVFCLVNAQAAFEQAILTGHYLERYGGDPSSVPAAISKAGDRYARFLAFIAADWLKAAGMVLPLQGACPQVEVKTILGGEGRKLQLKNSMNTDLGDLDVLYYDPRANEVRILELKHFKPGSDNVTALTRADENIDGKLARKVKERHRWVEEHLTDVLVFLRVEPEVRPRVRTTLVSSRPLPFQAGEMETTDLETLRRSLLSSDGD